MEPNPWWAFERSGTCSSPRRTAPDDFGYDPAEELIKLEGASDWILSRGQELPPGYRSHLGWMHYNQGQFEQARALFAEEAATYPESADLMLLLVQSMDEREAEVDA